MACAQFAAKSRSRIRRRPTPAGSSRKTEAWVSLRISAPKAKRSQDQAATTSARKATPVSVSHAGWIVPRPCWIRVPSATSWSSIGFQFLLIRRRSALRQQRTTMSATRGSGCGTRSAKRVTTASSMLAGNYVPNSR